MKSSESANEKNGSATARAAEAAHAGVDRAADVAEQYEERARRAGEDVQARANDAATAARSFIQERPLVSLGIAFLAGAVISSLMRR